jgi:nucleotide-binding universal stress UspA family protein
MEPAYGPLTRPVDDEPAVGARSTLDAVLAEAAIPDGVKVTSKVVGGNPAHELIKASEGADLLVVGSRGHGGFYGLLLGSVSQNVSEHARCTVVVAR